MKYRFTLKVPEGFYYANSLFGLFSEIVKHRFHHWRKGEGWRD